MKQSKVFKKRAFALFLALMMCVSMTVQPVFADELQTTVDNPSNEELSEPSTMPEPTAELLSQPVDPDPSGQPPNTVTEQTNSLSAPVQSSPQTTDPSGSDNLGNTNKPSNTISLNEVKLQESVKSAPKVETQSETKPESEVKDQINPSETKTDETVDDVKSDGKQDNKPENQNINVKAKDKVEPSTETKTDTTPPAETKSEPEIKPSTEIKVETDEYAFSADTTTSSVQAIGTDKSQTEVNTEQLNETAVKQPVTPEIDLEVDKDKEYPIIDTIPAEVQEFLNAAAALPDASEVTAENAVEIGDKVNAVLDMWDAMSVKNGEREDVTAALENVYAVYEAVLAAEEIPESKTFEGSGDSLFDRTYNIYSGIGYENFVDELEYGEVDLKINVGVGETWTDSGVLKAWNHGDIYEITSWDSVSVWSTNPNVLKVTTSKSGNTLSITYEGIANGTASVKIAFNATTTSTGTAGISGSGSSGAAAVSGARFATVTVGTGINDPVSFEKENNFYVPAGYSGLIDCTVEDEKGYYNMWNQWVPTADYRCTLSNISYWSDDTSVAKVEDYMLVKDTAYSASEPDSYLAVKIAGYEVGTTSVYVKYKWVSYDSEYEGWITEKLNVYVYKPKAAILLGKGQNYTVSYEEASWTDVAAERNTAFLMPQATNGTANPAVLTVLSSFLNKNCNSYQVTAGQTTGTVQVMTEYKKTTQHSNWETYDYVVDAREFIVVDPEATPEALIKKTVNNATPKAGEQITYTITVKNPSTTALTNLTVTDVLNENLTVEGINQPLFTRTGTANIYSGTITWNIPRIDADKTALLLITVKVKDTVKAGTVIPNAVSVKSNEKDVAPSEGSEPDVDVTVKSNDATYTVQWLDANNNNAELKSETRIGIVAEKVSVDEDDKKYNGYTYAGDNYEGTVLSAILAESGTVLKMYFKTDVPVRTPKIEVKKSNDGFNVDKESGNAFVDYTVTIKNISGFDIYGLKLTDTLTPTLTKTGNGEGIPSASYTFSNWKVDDQEITPISGDATDMKHELRLLPRNTAFEDQKTVTLTYTVEIETNNVPAKIELNNTADADSWSNKYEPSKLAKVASFFAMKTNAADDDIGYPDDPDIHGSAGSTTGGTVSGSGSSSTGGELPAKYTLTYEWNLPEGATPAKTLPTDRLNSRPAGSHFTVDTENQEGNEVTANGKTYVFSGWTVPDNVSTETEGEYQGQYIMPAHNIIITGEWIPKKEELTIEIVGNNNTVTYNGQKQSVTGYTMTVKDNNGKEISLPDGLTVTPASDNCTAEGTEANEESYPMGLTKDKFSLTGSNADNYTVTFTVTDGWLKINPPDKVLDVTAGDVETIYDGKEHPVTPVVTLDNERITDAEVTITYTYKDENGDTLTLPNGTAPKDAGIYTATIKAVKDVKEDSTTATVTINKRGYTVTTASDTKVYDSKPLTNANATVTVEGGKVEGEDITATANGSQTEVGSTHNTYIINWGTAKESNYELRNVELGTLTVTENSGSGSEDPEEASYTVEWYEVGSDTPFKTNNTRKGTIDTEVSVTDADKVVEGYTYVGDSDSRNILSATLAASGTVLKLYFTKDSGGGETPDNPSEYTVTVKYQDENGNPIAGYPDVTVNTTDSGKYDVTDRQVNIPDYTFNRVLDNKPLSGTISDNTEIILVYTKNPDPIQHTYTLTYDANGGTNPPTAESVGPVTDESHTFTVSGTAPARLGYTFLGWADTNNADAVVQYTAGASITLNPTAEVPNPTKTVYAVWRYNGGGSGGGGGGDISTPRPSDPGTNIPDTDTTLTDNPTDDPDMNIPDEEPLLADLPDEESPLADIPDSDMPLSDMPDSETPVVDSPDGDASLTDISDEATPLDDAPQTGDDSMTALWAVLCLLALIVMAGAALSSAVRKRRK